MSKSVTPYTMHQRVRTLSSKQIETILEVCIQYDLTQPQVEQVIREIGEYRGHYPHFTYHVSHRVSARIAAETE